VFAKHFFGVSANQKLTLNEQNRRKDLISTLQQDLKDETDTAYFNTELTCREIKRAIAEKLNTAAGKDIINYTMLKKIPTKTVGMTTRLFNRN
jgi:transketolase C-terminal domain/subunit